MPDRLVTVRDDQVSSLVETLIDDIAELVVLVDHLGSIRWANRRAENVLGVQVSDWIGQSVLSFLHPDDLALGVELLVSARATGAGVKEPVGFRLSHLDGSWLTVEVIASITELADGETAMIFTARPIDRRRAGDQILGEVSDRLSRMFEESAIGMSQIGLDGRILRVNPAFAHTLGATPAEIAGRELAELLHPDDLAARTIHAAVAAEDRPYRASTRAIAADGRIVHLEVTASLVHGVGGIPLYVALQAVDVTALRAIEAELRYQSSHDPLTGLANRAQLSESLTEALDDGRAANAPVAVLLLDLDGFKAINDAHGHAVGDRLLVAVAERVQANVRFDDVVARLGGDEFVVVCRGADSDVIAVEIGERIIDRVGVPFVLDDIKASVGVSIGIAVHHSGETTAAEMIRRADAALYEAKRSGRGRIAFDPHSTG